MKKRIFLVTAIFVILLLLSSTTTKVLIVGVGKFDDERIIPLPGAIADANNFQKAVSELGLARPENITLLENPSLGRFSATVNRFFSTAQPQDKLIFYYSGHGYTKDGKTYLIPSDTDPDFIETTGFNLTDNLPRLLLTTRAGEVVLIMDACNSGSIVKDRPLVGVRVETSKIEDIIKQKGAVLLLSSGPTEVSLEKPTGGGWFTHYLIEALKGEAGKGKEWITTKDIFEYVRQSVSRQTNGKQNPMLVGQKEIPLVQNIQEVYKQIALEILKLRFEKKISNDHFLLYMKILAQDQSEDNRLEKEIRGYLTEYAAERNLKLLTLQTQKAINEIGQPTPVKGTCSLKITPVNEVAKTGTVYLNGRETGKLDGGTVVIINLPIGTHTIVVDGEKIERWERQVGFKSENEVQEIKVEAKVATRMVRITTEPVGARIWIDGKEVGTSPWQGSLEIGKIYEIKAIRDGYRELVTKLNVSDKGDVMNVPLTLSQNRPPEVPKILTPADGEKDVRIELTLKWDSKDLEGDEVRYDLYFGTSSNPPLLARDLKNGEYKVSGLGWDTTYYWKVIAKDNLGAIREGALAKFTTHKAPGTVKWKLKIDGGIDSGITLDRNSNIYFSSLKGVVYAVNPDGKVLWQYEVGSTIDTTAALSDDGVLYIGASDGFLYALSIDGKLKWKFKTDGPINSSVALGKNGEIYFGSLDRNLYALTSDGKFLWKYQTTGPVFSSPAVGQDGTIYFGSDDGYLYAVSPNGNLLWKNFVGSVGRSSVALSDQGLLYIGSKQNAVFCFKVDGTLLWKSGTGHWVDSSPCLDHDRNVYVGSFDDYLYCFSRQGSLKWKQATGNDIWSSPLVGSNSIVYMASIDGCVYAFQSNGELKWRLKTDGPIYSRPNLSNDGVLYIGSRDGYLYAIQTDSYGLADSPWPKFRGNIRNTGRFGDK